MVVLICNITLYNLSTMYVSGSLVRRTNSFLKMLGHVKNKYVKEFPLFNKSLSFLLGTKEMKKYSDRFIIIH